MTHAFVSATSRAGGWDRHRGLPQAQRPSPVTAVTAVNASAARKASKRMEAITAIRVGVLMSDLGTAHFSRDTVGRVR